MQLDVDRTLNYLGCQLDLEIVMYIGMYLCYTSHDIGVLGICKCTKVRQGKL
jgi:hypothetical protein